MEIRIRCRTNNQGEYFLRLKAFNSPIDTTHLLPRLSTDWECSVHSYVLNLQGSSANPEVEVMRLNCNAIEFDRSLKQQHLIKVLVNTVKMQHVKTFRWKKIIVSNYHWGYSYLDKFCRDAYNSKSFTLCIVLSIKQEQFGFV